MNDELRHDRPPLREEIANAVTHGLGALASAVAGGVLITLAALQSNPWHVIGASVFVGALVLLYTASTLYHAFPFGRAKVWLRTLDHCAIYVLIAGTYTPFLLAGMGGGWGWSWGWAFFAVVWGLAAAGVAFKLLFIGRFPRLSTVIYLAMGWLAVVIARPLIESLPTATLAWLVGGGLAYTVGTVFYHSRRIPYAHAVWHLFVLAGSACHFVAVLIEVLRAV